MHDGVCVCVCVYRMAWHCIDLFIDPVVLLSYDDLSLSTGNIQTGTIQYLNGYIHILLDTNPPSMHTTIRTVIRTVFSTST